MKPKLVVFDLAGTTVNDNNDVSKALQRLFKKIHIRISIQEGNELMGIPKPEAIGILLERHHYPFISKTLIEEMHAYFMKDMIKFYQKHASVKEKPGASEIFLQLREHKIKVVVDTGFNRSIVAPLLDRMGWLKNELIDGSVTNDEVPNGRPHPDLIYRAMELTGIKNPKDVAKVGDTIFDLNQGAAAQCGWVIGITTGAYSREQLSKGPHTHLIDHLSELSSLFHLE
ncbi:MAG TPA: phosphonoacetaldehyde hydrolase [Cytophagales bacterium]|jgi:phosphonatase-like hydrolase|nr:phosphonoacetaldehyde hydrolase [Cytophagales bacterium]